MSEWGKRAPLYRADRKKGLTYQAIADKYGVSKQCVYQACAAYRTNTRFREFTPKQCIYINLRNWLNDNRINLKELICRLGLEPLSVNYGRICQYLTGYCYPQKKMIDKFISVTGLTYEQLFELG